ncbi:MAG: DUF2207 family protein [Fimbriimonadaceae bacterium]
MLRLGGVVSLLFSACVTFGQAYRADHVQVEMKLDAEGRLKVVETFDITYRWSASGMSRNFPFSVQTHYGDARLVRVRNLQAWDESGNPVSVEVDGQRGDFGKYLIDSSGPKAEAKDRRTYTIAYEVDGTVAFSEKGNETEANFVWPLAGEWREQSISSLTWQVEFPAQRPADPVRGLLFTHQQSTFAIDELDGVGSLRGENTGGKLLMSYGFFEGTLEPGLDAYQGAIISLRLPGYLFAGSKKSVAGLVFAWRNLVLLLPLLAAASLYWYQKRYGRDERFGVSASLPELLHGVSPAGAGVLQNGRAHRDHLAAALASLMAQGHLLVEWTELKPANQRPRAVFRLVQTKHELPQGAVENRILELLLETKRTRFDEKEVRKAISPFTPVLKRELYSELMGQGYLRDSPGETMSRVNFIGFLSLIGLIGALGMVRALPSWPWVLLAVASTEMVVINFSQKMTMRTAKGARAHKETTGSDDALTKFGVEPRQVLPYAISLNRLEEWTKIFENQGLPKGLRSQVEGSENWPPSLVAHYLRHTLRAAIGVGRKLGILAVFAPG